MFFIVFCLCNWFLISQHCGWTRCMMIWFRFFSSLPRLDVWPKMWLSVGECMMCRWEERVFCCFLDAVFYKHQFSPSGLMCHLRPVFPCDFLSRCLSREVPHSYCVTVKYFFYGCSCLPYVLRGSYVGCAGIYSCYILNWSLHHCVVTFLVSCSLFCLIRVSLLQLSFDLHLRGAPFPVPSLCICA